jgi:hypothetical protein
VSLSTRAPSVPPRTRGRRYLSFGVAGNDPVGGGGGVKGANVGVWLFREGAISMRDIQASYNEVKTIMADWGRGEQIVKGFAM